MQEPDTSLNADAPSFPPPTRPAPDPDQPSWSAPLAFGMWLLSVALIFVVPAIFLVPYIFTLGADVLSSGELPQRLSSDPLAIVLQILSIIPAHLLTLAAAWLVVTNRMKVPFREALGWETGGMKWWHHALIMFAFLALALAVSAVLPEQENEMLRILNSSKYAVFLVAFMAVVTAPIVEEVIYRGLLYSALQRSLGVGGAVALVTFLFALVHVPQYYPSVSTMILLTLLSLILTLVRARTGNLLPCIILHTVFNAFQSFLIIAQRFVGTEAPQAEPATSVLSMFLK